MQEALLYRKGNTMKRFAMIVALAFSAQAVDAASIGVNIGDTDVTNWNKVYTAGNAPYPTQTIDNLVYLEDGSPSGISLQAGGFGGFNLAGPGGTVSGLTYPGLEDPSAASAYFPTAVATSAGYGHPVRRSNNANTYPEILVTLSNLDPGSLYQFTFFSSRVAVSDNRETRFTVTGATVDITDLDASSNYSNIAQTGFIAPDANNQIVVSVTAGPGNNSVDGEYDTRWFHFNGMHIEVVPVPEPASLSALALGGIA